MKYTISLFILLLPFVLSFQLHGTNVTWTKGGRTLLSESSVLKIVRTKIPPKHYVSVINRETFITNETTEEMHAELLPEHKYNPKSINATWLIIRSISHPVPPKWCTVTPYEFKQTYSAKCKRKGGVIFFARDPDVYSVDGHVAVEFQVRRETTEYEQYTFEYTPPITDIPAPVYSTIVVTDTGLDLSHCAFGSNAVVRNINGSTDRIAVKGAHGTATTGVAAGGRCAGTQGMAAGAPIIFGDMSPVGEGESLIGIDPGFFTAFLNDTYIVHSASYGMPGAAGLYVEACRLFDQDAYDNPYHVHYISGGNYYPNVCTPPCTAKSSVCVGASDGSQIADFSSRGTLPDGREYPMVWAQGVYVWSPYALDYPPGRPGHADYAYWSGTSFSCPLLAGIGLLERERRTKEGMVVTGALVRAIALVYYRFVRNFRMILSSPDTSVDFANGLTVPSQGIAVCYQFSAPVSINLALSYNDMPSQPGTTGSLLINDINAYIHTNKDLSFYNDDKASFEYGSLAGVTFVRIFMFPQYPVIGMANVSGHMAWKGATDFPNMTSCGLCVPGDIISCGGNQTQQCLPNGTLTACSSCLPGYEPQSELCVCNTGIFIHNGTSVLSNPCTGTLSSRENFDIISSGASTPRQIILFTLGVILLNLFILS